MHRDKLSSTWVMCISCLTNWHWHRKHSNMLAMLTFIQKTWGGFLLCARHWNIWHILSFQETHKLMQEMDKHDKYWIVWIKSYGSTEGDQTISWLFRKGIVWEDNWQKYECMSVWEWGCDRAVQMERAECPKMW